MNKNIFEGKWKQIRGAAKAWWGKLTQGKYGYTRKHAVDEIDKRVIEYETNLKKKPVPVRVPAK